MFINNINPDLINLGPFSIRFYGIVYALGFILIAYILSKQAEKKRIKNLSKDMALDIVIYGMISGLIGARIFHVLSEFSLYKDNLLDMFAIWQGGLGFLGGLITALVFVYYYCRKHNIEALKLLDFVAMPTAFILFFGRIANYINSEHIGYPSNVNWCVAFEKVDAVCRHPAQIYEAISMLILFFILILFYNKWKHKTGLLFYHFIAGYGLARFITDYFRQQNIFLLGLTHTQIISIIMITAGIYYIYKINRKKVKS